MRVNDVFLDRRMTILHFFCICNVLLICFLLIMNMFFGQIPANSAYLYLQYDVAFFLHIMICFIGHW